MVRPGHMWVPLFDLNACDKSVCSVLWGDGIVLFHSNQRVTHRSNDIVSEWLIAMFDT